MNMSVGCKAVLGCMVIVSVVGASRKMQAAEPVCTSAAYRQFDFWAGDWDVFEAGAHTKVAHTRVDPILDGCVLREDYEGSDGHHGQSFSIYDSARQVWHQSWVTNRGELLEIEGTMRDGAMVMSGEDLARHLLVRGAWKPESGGVVRETASRSADHGKTWQPWFDLIFRRASDQPGDPPDSDDRSAIKALDTRYQAAVKSNDAATMAQILADDFTLVTGSGKTYSKVDLLQEARSGRIQYERQDDTDQTVRIWGNIAIITARLKEKGTDSGKPFDYDAWFSDTYMKTATGWKYVFAQSSLPLNRYGH